jgi:hypothetical protein
MRDLIQFVIVQHVGYASPARTNNLVDIFVAQ